MKDSTQTVDGDFSESQFWEKLRRYAKSAGVGVVERALQLFFAAQSPGTPAWAKAVVYGALTYFIVPTDVIPDFIPGAGYTDDLGVLAMALGSIAIRVTPEIKAHARQKMQDWFKA